MSTRPRDTQIPIGPLVAAAGAILLIVSLFLDWYEVDLEGFTVFEFLDLLLVVMALATIASLAGGLGLVKPAPSPVVSLAVALFTIFVVVSQILNDPPAVAGGDRGKEIGIWLALGGAALMTAGSLLAFARISLAVETRAGPGRDREAQRPPTARRERDDDDAPQGTRDPDATLPLADPDRPT
jgi:hypothetical protein